MKKTYLLIVFAVIGTVSLLRAQSNQKKDFKSICSNLNYLIKTKLKYEASLYYHSRDSLILKEAYIKVIQVIKERKMQTIYLSGIDSMMKYDSISLSKKYLEYKFQPKMNSSLKQGTIITYFEYLQIVKKCLFDRDLDLL
jgi:hypothetical protein